MAKSLNQEVLMFEEQFQVAYLEQLSEFGIQDKDTIQAEFLKG